MPASKLSHFPFYFRDYLLSKSRLSFTPAQRGAYLDILCLCYDSEDGCIEWDTDYLVSITGATKEDITTVQRAFNDRSTGVQSGKWTHARVQTELERITAQHEAASRAGKSSAAKRLSNGRSTGVQRAKKRVQPAEHSKALLGARPQAGTLAAPLPAPSGSPSAPPEPEPIPTRTPEEIEVDRARSLAMLRDPAWGKPAGTRTPEPDRTPLPKFVDPRKVAT